MDRIQKLISQAGVASRRKAEELIKAGKVSVNGKIAILGDKGTFADAILVNGKALQREELIYYMINKPTKTISTLNDPQGRRIITDLINDDRHIFPVGRLDYDTTGTLLLTNDGDLSNKLTHPSNGIMRVYRARLFEPLSAEDLKFLNSDQVIMDNRQSNQTVEKVDSKTYVVSLAVGTYHHVKRLFEMVNNEVITLTRIEFAGLTHVGKLSKGEYRKLNPKEIKWLKDLVKDK
ncbi:MAG: rRNA pseudouridine synthase [Mycoplasmataceae bacterium]|nr:rRNA pseudouridine synthase [Mycoplasmataceae bacterium]